MPEAIPAALLVTWALISVHLWREELFPRLPTAVAATLVALIGLLLSGAIALMVAIGALLFYTAQGGCVMLLLLAKLALLGATGVWLVFILATAGHLFVQAYQTREGDDVTVAAAWAALALLAIAAALFLAQLVFGG